jgi:hypothetical protein
MSRVLDYLLRFAVIIVGYAVASLAASAFLNVVMLALVVLTDGDAPGWDSIIFTIPIVTLFVAYFAFIPSTFAILAGEIFSKRDWLFYALAGGIVGTIAFGFLRGAARHEAATDLNLAFAMIASGMVGGIGYWLIAGRSAGSWRPAAEPVAADGPGA